MRAGAYTIQQTLTAEAASVLKHSLGLARRRGHAQVTPLHVAATLLSSRSSLLRRACLKSQQNPAPNNGNSNSSGNHNPQHHHPLQCRALELCFNVALNRLPTSPSPLLHGGQATLSNALIAALKRAQAHQRRGCIEQQQQQQQQPLLAVKVELEQLVISILDDPSVSRVMREAGFSSTAVKSNIEEDSSASSVFHCYSGAASGGGGVFSSPSSPTRAEYAPRDVTVIPSPGAFWHTQPRFMSPLHFSPSKKILGDSVSPREDDIKLVLEVLLREKRRNVVVVGDSLSATDGLVMELMARVERGEVPNELKSASFIKFQFATLSFKYMKLTDVDSNITELKRKIDGFLAGGGRAIVYAGDLAWAVEEKCGSVLAAAEHSPADHLVSQMGKLLSDYLGSSAGARVWLVGTANLQTYMKCQRKQPPLEVQWGLQAVSVPSGGLGLSLHAAPSSIHERSPFAHAAASQALEIKPLPSVGEQDGQLTCCAECTSNYEKEAAFFNSGHSKLLPSWLQAQGPDAPHKEYLAELKKKWNRLCQGLHQERTRNYGYTSSYVPMQKQSWWHLQSGIFPDGNSSITFASQSPSTVPRFRRQQSCTIDFDSGSWNGKNQRVEPNLDSLRNSEGKEVKITLSLGNSLFNDSGKLAEHNIERMLQRGNARRLLQDNVPWQSETIPAIVEALFDSKSTIKDTWLLLHGNDTTGKRRLARAIAEAIFGSSDLVININMRAKNSVKSLYSEIFSRISKDNEKLVVLVENVELADKQLIKFLSDRFEMGKITDSSHGREQDRGQVVYILTRGDAASTAGDERKSQNSVVHMAVRVVETTLAGSIDLKRKAEWDLSDRAKLFRTDGKGNGNGYLGILTKGLFKQSSFNVFDLNEKAREDGGEIGDKDVEELSPNSSDLTGESGGEITSPQAFLGLIENQFSFNLSLTRDREMTEFFLSKIRGSFEEVYGGGNKVRFNVEDCVLEGIVIGAGVFLNSLFEKWLKDTFQTAMHIVKKRGRDGISLSLCLGDKGKGNLEDGYMNTCLPKNIQISSGN